MNDLRQKFIITTDGEMYIGRAVFHKDLLMYEDPVAGGGWWYWDRDKDVLYLYGTSVDYGQVTKQQIDDSEFCSNRGLKSAKIVFEEDEDKTIYEILKEHMDIHRAMDLVASNDFI
jgi:hypothetical protein